MKLSPSQRDVLERLAACDEPIAYFKGGFWTLPSLGNAVPPLKSPAWSTLPQTLKSLVKLGLLKRAAFSTNYDIARHPDLGDYALTPEGLSLVTGCDVLPSQLVNAVVRYTGNMVTVSSYHVLPQREWIEFLENQARCLSSPQARHELICDTAALLTEDGRLVVQKDNEIDALHELLHAAGIAPQTGETHFICEGLTQAAAEEIGRMHNWDVRRTYPDEVGFVNKYLVPLTNLPLRKLVITYIQSGLFGVVDHIDTTLSHATVYQKLAQLKALPWMSWGETCKYMEGHFHANH